MILTYTTNPLSTRVDLNKAELELLRLKIVIQEYEDLLFEIHHRLTAHRDPDGAAKLAAPGGWEYDDGAFNVRVQHMLNAYVKALKDHHAGDCTALPGPCIKCHAEEALGICTIEGISKAAGYALLKQLPKQ